MSWLEAVVGSRLPRPFSASRQCDAAASHDPAVSPATVVAALLAVLCVALVLRVIQLQRRLAPRQPGRPASQKPLLTIAVPQTPATPAPAPSPEPATIFVGGGGAAGQPWPLDDIEAYLVDLDGTIYSPNGPIEGAAEFYASVLRHRPHVFLSNTGAKGADGVRQKLLRNGLC